MLGWSVAGRSHTTAYQFLALRPILLNPYQHCERLGHVRSETDVRHTESCPTKRMLASGLLTAELATARGNRNEHSLQRNLLQVIDHFARQLFTVACIHTSYLWSTPYRAVCQMRWRD